MAATRFNEPIEPMTLGNMRANGVRSLDVCCWLCHHRAIISAAPWPDDVPVQVFGPRMVCTRCGIVGADARAGAAAALKPDGGAMAVSRRVRDLSGEQRRALEMLAGSPFGCPEEILRAHGLTVRLLAGIVRAGFALAKPEIVKAGGRTLSMLRLTITDLGRQTLAGM
jgi:hypothetical protein